MSEIYGVDPVDPDKLVHPFSELADTPEKWRSIFDDSLSTVRKYLTAHDAFELLAKCTNQVMAGQEAKKENPRWASEKPEPYELIEPAELEILQALALMQVTPRKQIPASPRSMYRFLSGLPKLSYAFSCMQLPQFPGDPHKENLTSKIRMQTIFYRNLFVKEDCENVVRSIFQKIDGLAVETVGFSFY